MKRNLARTSLGIIVLLFLAVLTQVAQARECSPRGIAGNYGYTSSGAIVTPAIGLFTAVGRVTFTDSGTFSGSQTTSIAGNFFDEIVQGTYTLNPDCTATAVVYVYHGTTLARTTRLNIVWDNHQREARGLFLTTGTAITINARKMFDDDDD